MSVNQDDLAEKIISLVEKWAKKNKVDLKDSENAYKIMEVLSLCCVGISTETDSADVDLQGYINDHNNESIVFTLSIRKPTKDIELLN